MYTRCPSCRAEISFDPPANKDSLPENYRHRIKCPSCGVTIGVKINQNPQVLGQPMGRPALAPPPGSTRQTASRQNATRNTSAYGSSRTNNYGTARNTAYGNQRPASYGTAKNTYAEPKASPYSAPSYKEAPQSTKSAPANTKKAKTQKNAKADKRVATATKKNGTLRNIIMMLCSLVFIALSVVGYLLAKKIINLPESFAWVAGASFFNGISGWEDLIKNFDGVKALFQMDALMGIGWLLPILLFTFSGINFIVAFVSTIGRKYGRAFNVIFSLLIAAIAVGTLFAPFLMQMKLTGSTDVVGYLSDLIKSGAYAYLFIAGCAWGVVQLLFALIFIKSLKKKDADIKGGKNSKNGKKAPSKKGRK